MIWLIRHGQTEFNAAGRIQGAKDSPLTALGVEQGKRIGTRLREVVPMDARIIASPLGRTQHTARLVREASGLTSQIETDARLAELSLGEWDGMLRDDIRKIAPDFDVGQSRWNWFFTAPGADSYEAMTDRLGGWLEDARAHAGPIVAVSHGVAGRILRGLFLQLPRYEALTLDIPQDAFFGLNQGQIERIDCP